MPHAQTTTSRLAKDVQVTFLGGLGDIGRNCAVIELGDAALLIDCGLMFPRADMPGVDLVLPDFSYLDSMSAELIGCVITHGHEDHTGGLAHLLPHHALPLYGSEWSLALASKRLTEAGLLDRALLHPVEDGQRLQLGPFGLEFIPACHSVPHGFATVIRTPAGNIVHSGDWKIDLTPVDGRRTDLARLGMIAKSEGIHLFLGDSTNAEEPGHSVSESAIGAELYSLFHQSEGKRLIVSCFASHIHRVQQVCASAVAFGRKIATLGLSMKRNVDLARELGLLDIDSNDLIDISELSDYQPGEICIVSTGSQGEPMSALALMATGQSRWLTVCREDVVILSSTPIPGNESSITRVIDGLCRRGAKVIHSSFADVHTSGHAQQEELKLLLSLLNPDWFVPVHGEFRHLAAHARLAEEVGIPSDRVLVCEDGAQLIVRPDGVRQAARIPAPYVYVDGSIGEVGSRVLRDRQSLAESGVISVTIAVDLGKRRVIGLPAVRSKGWVYEPSSSDLLAIVADDALAVIRGLIERTAKPPDHSRLEQELHRSVRSTVAARTSRRPTVFVSIITSDEKGLR